MLADAMLVTAEVGAALDRLGVRYVVGGSLATSIYGIPRATQDVDVIAEIGVAHAEPLARELGAAFYADADMIADAARRRASCNVIHLATMFKADLFVATRDAWVQEELGRGRREQLMPDDPRTVSIATPEDALLHKLVWFRMGGETSERQWRDVLRGPGGPGRDAGRRVPRPMGGSPHRDGPAFARASRRSRMEDIQGVTCLGGGHPGLPPTVRHVPARWAEAGQQQARASVPPWPPSTPGRQFLFGSGLKIAQP
jgi:hypothetical protein